MTDFFSTLRLIISCGTLLALVFLILLALPKSQLRCIVLQIVGWLFAAFCGVYVISPVDIIPEIVLGPFGMIDDLGAIIAGLSAAGTAIQAGKDRLRLHD